MSRREKLMENYEDALFAILMDKVAEEEGARLREENKRLMDDPDAEVPEEIDAAARQTIRKAFAGQNRKNAYRIVGKIVNRVAVAVLICSLLFVTAYAAFPEVQLRTLNLLIQTSDVASRLVIVSDEDSTAHENPANETITLCGYSFPDLNGFIIVEKNEDKHGGWMKLENDRDGALRIEITKGINTIYVDSENAERTNDVVIKGYSGILVEKDSRITIAWSETEINTSIALVVTNLSSDFALHVAEQIIYVGT